MVVWSPSLLLSAFPQSPQHKLRKKWQWLVENAMSEFHWKLVVEEIFCLDRASFVESLVANHWPHQVFRGQWSSRLAVKTFCSSILKLPFEKDSSACDFPCGAALGSCAGCQGLLRYWCSAGGCREGAEGSLRLLPHRSHRSHFPNDGTGLRCWEDFSKRKSDQNVIKCEVLMVKDTFREGED